MASTNYTAAQLFGNNGEGTSSINLSASVEYLFTVDSTSGSNYFTMETVRNNQGFYDSSSKKNTSGSYFSNAIPSRISSDYFSGFALKPSPYNSFTFTPAINVTGSTLMLRGTGNVTLSIFNPLSLFSAGEKGVWFDPTDITTLFQDAAGITPVTGYGQKVGRILDKSGNGNHATQSNAAFQPTYRIDNEGNPNLDFDGINDQLVTRAIDFTGTSKIMIAMGLNVISASLGVPAVAMELGTSVALVNGSFSVGAPSATADHSLNIRGTATVNARTANVSNGDDLIIGLFDLSQPTKETQLIPRFNRVQLTGSQITWTGASSAGGGTFGNLPLYIGSEGLSQTLPYGGKIYQIIVRGVLTNASDITQTENLVDAKMD
jgi:hypothetical protein